MSTSNYNPTISIIMPALNEESTIREAIDDVLFVLRDNSIKGEIVIVNDGSTDSTPIFIQNKIKDNPDVITTVNHNTRKGVGASFWDGADIARGEFICMVPADRENDPREVLRYLNLLKDVDMVIPFSFNINVRPRSRNILSNIYRFIINNTFSTLLNYANGTTIYRRELLNDLTHRCIGFFFQTDILIRLIKKGYLFAEVPYKLKMREKGKSKAVTWGSLVEVIRGYINLFFDIYIKKSEAKGHFIPNSATFRRYQEIAASETNS